MHLPIIKTTLLFLSPVHVLFFPLLIHRSLSKLTVQFIVAS